MRINGEHYRTIWERQGDPKYVEIIDQRPLPHEFKIEILRTVDDAVKAIKDMYVRGAPLIGATAAYAMVLAAYEAADKPDFDKHLFESADKIIASRPTAVNLAWAVKEQLKSIAIPETVREKIEIAVETARVITENDVNKCRRIGEFGSELIRKISEEKKGEKVNVLTHCNAGWLATVDYGTATSPIYAARELGIDLHVWVDETRPRNQGAKLTAFELLQEGIDHSVIVDNVGGHLMQHGMVDIVIVGSDRTTYTGDVANKIGTYLKALAARDNGIPFYVALPSSTIDFELRNGVKEIPIETRDADEVRKIDGLIGGKIGEVLVPPAESECVNYAFDVTPGRLVTGLITERGICPATESGVLDLFPEKSPEL